MGLVGGKETSGDESARWAGVGMAGMRGTMGAGAAVGRNGGRWAGIPTNT